jgi:hypothetical protein
MLARLDEREDSVTLALDGHIGGAASSARRLRITLDSRVAIGRRLPAAIAVP